MAISNDLLKSFASITNDSKTTVDNTIGYGYAIVEGSDVYVIMDSNVAKSDLNLLIDRTDFVIDYKGNGKPSIKNNEDGSQTYQDNNGLDLKVPVSDTSNDGGDLYLNKDDYSLYISHKNTYDTVTDGVADTYSVLEWERCCILTPAVTTVDLNNGDRVITSLKNHRLTITGNITHPGTTSLDGSIIDLEWASEDIDFSNYI